MFNFLNTSIRNKILAIPLVIIISISLLAILYFPSNKATETKQTLSEEIDIAADLLAYGFGVALDASDFKAMTAVYETLKEKKQISYVIIFDEQNKVINSYNPHDFKIDLDRSSFSEKILLTRDFIEKAKVIKTAAATYGTVVVGISLQSVKEKVSSIITSTLLVSLAFLALFITIALLVSNRIIQPIKAVMNTLNSLKNGDLTQKCHVTSVDETKHIAAAVNQTIDSFDSIIRNIKSYSGVLTEESGHLSEKSSVISSNSSSIVVKTSQTTQSVKDSDNSVSAISDTAGQMSMNINTIASSIEEMSASLNEVARNCQRESQIASEANTQSKLSRQLMDKLDLSAKEISKIVDAINDVAKRTNLLALNATIEAASAGEAGKGFAVVAAEVKDLAHQTANATNQIKKLVKEMQSNTDNAVNAIAQIDSIIGDVNIISQTIVSAVEEQSTTISEISKNMTNVNTSAHSIASNVNTSSNGIKQIMTLIVDVDSSVKETTSSVSVIKGSADQLAKIVEGLNNIIMKFKVSEKV
ncbi:MAG: methyl-accepting chemotaxis protein [Fibrobacterota bacterium]|nr:methyl-accepting chemotaxis protein [Chitinispirillaceae bacterium]